jgi:hypothetical protein
LPSGTSWFSTSHPSTPTHPPSSSYTPD